MEACLSEPDAVSGIFTVIASVAVTYKALLFTMQLRRIILLVLLLPAKLCHTFGFIVANTLITIYVMR
jgi:hypothetical protein